MTIQCELTTPLDMPASVAVSGGTSCTADEQLRPSEYTTLLIQALRADPDAVVGVSALEIGYGSGVVLAALGSLGAAHLCGVDVEPEAAVVASRLLDEMGHGAIAELFQGDMWLPVAGRQFDLIVANLPHFPTEDGPVGGRLPTWSCGGPDGRAYLDEFIDGLDTYLRPGGRALATHNAFVDLDFSREMAARYNLEMRIVVPSLVYIPSEKLRTMTNSVRLGQQGRTIHAYGRHCFADMSIVEFRRV